MRGDQQQLRDTQRERVKSLRATRGLLALAVPILMLAVLMLTVLMLTVGCADQIAGPSGPNPGDTTMPVPPSSSIPGGQSMPTSATPSGGHGDTDLTIVVDNGSGSTSTWQLSCNPPDGTHPDPKAACRALQANGALALPPVPKDKACTQIYGGPETATITGRWQGQDVISRFARNDGCQISRWKLMEGLLPPGGR
jgi:hypothetical protein